MSTLQYEITLTEEDKKYATSILSEPESEEERRKAVDEIKKWIDSNSNYKGKYDDKIIIQFLRNCKYRPESVQAKLKNYLEVRVKEDSWFTNRDPKDPEQLELLKTGTVLPLRGHEKEGRTVILVRTGAYDPSKNCFLDIFKTGHMIMDLLTELDETVSVYGVHALLDLSGNTVSHLLQLTPPVISRAVHAWQNCYPVRTRQIDFFNAPIYANLAIKIFVKFMNEKLKKRVHAYGSDKSDLLQIVDPAMLPEEYGGTAGTTKELTDYWINRLMEHREWFVAAK